MWKLKPSCVYTTCTRRQQFDAFVFRAKTQKGLKRTFLIGQNKTKNTNFEEILFFKTTYNTETNKKRGFPKKKLRILSCSVQVKSILFNLLCVFYLFFSERWQSALFQMLWLQFIRTMGQIIFCMHDMTCSSMWYWARKSLDSWQQWALTATFHVGLPSF